MPSHGVQQISFVDKNQLFVLCDHKVWLIDIGEVEPKLRLVLDQFTIKSLCLSLSKKWMACTTEIGELTMFDVNRVTLVRRCVLLPNERPFIMVLIIILFNNREGF
jgi:hypothetical protein